MNILNDTNPLNSSILNMEDAFLKIVHGFFHN